MGGTALITRGLRLRCSVCGTDSEQSMSNGFDFSTDPDMDQRPRPAMEGELECRVMRCPGCGYCAANISTDVGVTREMVDDPDYRSILSADRDEVLSNFIAKGYLMERTGYYIGAFDAYRSAAWIADDLKDGASAKAMRNKAIESGRVFIEKMIPVGRVGYGDILRRAGRFDECVSMMDEVLSTEGVSDDVRASAEFEKRLCSINDMSRHSSSESYHA